MPLYDVDREVSSGKAFIATISNYQVASVSEYELFLLKNPSDSGKEYLITKLNVYLGSTVTSTLISVYGNPTITSNGTALTILNSKITASPPSSSATAYRSPTISDSGNLLDFFSLPANAGSEGHNRFFHLDPGNNLLVTVKNSVISIPTYFQAYWIET